MGVRKANPTSPGRRFVISLEKNHLYKGRPLKKLTEKKTKKGGNL